MPWKSRLAEERKLRAKTLQRKKWGISKKSQTLRKASLGWITCRAHSDLTVSRTIYDSLCESEEILNFDLTIQQYFVFLLSFNDNDLSLRSAN